MRELELAIFYWLHLLATVIWIGGLAFILLIAIPSAKQVLGTDAGKLMGEISKRFTPLANYSILLLVVTGILLMGLSKQFTGITVFDNNRALFITLKHIIVLSMIAIHFYRGMVLTPKIGRIVSSTDKTSLQKISLNLVKVNFVLGVLVLLLSGMSSMI